MPEDGAEPFDCAVLEAGALDEAAVLEAGALDEAAVLEAGALDDAGPRDDEAVAGDELLTGEAVVAEVLAGVLFEASLEQAAASRVIATVVASTARLVRWRNGWIIADSFAVGGKSTSPPGRGAPLATKVGAVRPGRGEVAVEHHAAQQTR